MAVYDVTSIYNESNVDIGGPFGAEQSPSLLPTSTALGAQAWAMMVLDNVIKENQKLHSNLVELHQHCFGK